MHRIYIRRRRERWFVYIIHLGGKTIIFKNKNIIINTTGKKRDDHLSLVQDWYRNKEQNVQRKKKKTLQFKNITVGFKMLTGD